MLRLKTIATFVAVCTVGIAGNAIADNHMKANLADVWMVEVKEGMDKDFRAAFKDHLKFREKKGDVRPYRVYSPFIGDDLNYYVIRYCCFTYADMDEYADWGAKSKVGDHWNDNVDQYVSHYRHYLSEVDFENSHWPEDDDHFRFYGVTTYKHKLGRGAQIGASKAALAGAAKADGWPRHWSFLQTVGGRSSHELVTPFANFAEMAPPEENFYEFLARNHGADKAREMLDSWTDNFHATSYTVYRYLPDMSADSDKK